MSKWAMMAGAVLFTVGAVVGLSQVRAADNDEVTISRVMKDAMKGGLTKKVAEGKADDNQKQTLLVLFQGMARAEPPAGDEASWKDKTVALVNGARRPSTASPRPPPC